MSAAPLPDGIAGVVPVTIPDDLREHDSWVLWRYEEREGRPTKVPYQPNNKRANTTDPATWRPCEEVLAVWQLNQQRFAGIGFVFPRDAPYTGVDLDSCLDEGRNPLPWAQPIIEAFGDTYMEISPSGKGVKIFAKGRLPGNGKRKDFGDHAIELYDKGRFFAVTGRAFNGAPLQIEDHQNDIEKLYAQISGAPIQNGHATKVGDKIPQGQRHNTLVSLAGTMRRRGMSVDAIDVALQTENLARCEPPYDRQHVRKIAESAAQWEPAGPSKIIGDLLHQPYTDTGNAERLVALHGANIRFCSETKSWLVWDGRRWNAKDTRQVKVLAKQTIRQMYVMAAAIGSVEIKEAAEKHARRSESASSIHSLLSCAEYEGDIPVEIGDLDQNKYLLNVLNGTLDLRTGELREHRREDLITKLVHFDFDPTAECPRFLQFLGRIMGGTGPNESEQPDEEREVRGRRVDGLMDYLQKCFGYALTADVSEKAVFCFFGSGNNGKTTLLETMRFILREYSSQVLIDNLMSHHSRESNASLADLGDLRGARFVTTSEAEEGQRLAVGKLKYLTQGGGEIKTCKKYQNPVTFLASHKLFLDANHKPIIRGAEKAVWNRLKLVPFTVTIPPYEIDKSLLETLKSEGAGILRWMVDGAERWRKHGLGDPPEQVTEASEAWQAESDRFPVFLEDRCLLARNTGGDPKRMWISVTNLWTAYVAWCEANNERPLMKPAFNERLEELGCQPGKENDGTLRVWRGIRFKPAQ